MRVTKSPKTKKPLPPPGRKLALKEAQERVQQKFAKAFAKLAK
jgi:hypothetical protein